jgi:hypothetical protein
VLVDDRARRALALILTLAVGVAAGGCSAVMSRATARLSSNLSAALLDHNDPETVRDGAPAFLLLVDGLIQGDPDNPDLLLSGAKLYSAYASVFVDDDERAGRLAEKARDYGWRAMCRTVRSTCGIWTAPYDEFEPVILGLEARHMAAVFGSAAAWASWIQVRRDDWEAIADKARVELMMQQVEALGVAADRGNAHLYLGVLDTLLPEAMGGRPEEGRGHFETAIAMSNGRDLMAKVMFAQEYARLVFDRELHDRLCREVLESEAEAPGLTLTNTLAQRRAEELLAESEDYFGE